MAGGAGHPAGGVRSADHRPIPCSQLRRLRGLLQKGQHGRVLVSRLAGRRVRDGASRSTCAVERCHAPEASLRESHLQTLRMRRAAGDWRKGGVSENRSPWRINAERTEVEKYLPGVFSKALQSRDANGFKRVLDDLRGFNT